MDLGQPRVVAQSLEVIDNESNVIVCHKRCRYLYISGYGLVVHLLRCVVLNCRWKWETMYGYVILLVFHPSCCKGIL